MEKHLLVTVSNDPSSLYGARFVSSFFANKEQLKTTLFYDAPTADPKLRTADFGSVTEARKAARRHRDKGWQALEQSQNLLCSKGISKENVSCRFTFKQFGTVKDIVKEGSAGLYDAVVLGRRGYSLFESVLSNSVTREMLEEDLSFPIWICKSPEPDRKGVLLCVDGSEPALHIADHVGFIVENEPQHPVCLLHIDTGNGGDVDAILDQARQKLLQNNVAEERITHKVVKSTRIVNTIMEEYNKQRFAAIAVGRVGMQKSRLHEWMVGSSTVKLVQSLEHGALWINW